MSAAATQRDQPVELVERVPLAHEPELAAGAVARHRVDVVHRRDAAAKRVVGDFGLRDLLWNPHVILGWRIGRLGELAASSKDRFSASRHVRVLDVA